jgi:hypothetical protein
VSVYLRKEIRRELRYFGKVWRTSGLFDGLGWEVRHADGAEPMDATLGERIAKGSPRSPSFRPAARLCVVFCVQRVTAELSPTVPQWARLGTLWRFADC